MFRPKIQDTKILMIMAFIAILSVMWVSKSFEYIQSDDILDKKDAVSIMSEYLKAIKKMPGNIISEDDLYKTGLIGVDSSLITTIFENNDKSFLKSKTSCTHPNFAALVVNLFNEAELDKGDTIAISMSGSLPGANIAVLSACETFNITPIIISSVGSSSWGANRENLTWLDMETYLYNNSLLKHRNQGVSIGGESDLGENIRKEGIEIIEENIIDNGSMLINENTLKKNINKKMEIYSDFIPVENYKGFINIGGNASALGYGAGKDTMKVGVIFPIETDDLIENDDYFKESIAYKFLKEDVVFINIKNINILGKQWGLYPPENTIRKNEGNLFYTKEPYNLKVIIASLLINLIIIIAVGSYSHNQIKRRMRNEEFDSIL